MKSVAELKAQIEASKKGQQEQQRTAPVSRNTPVVTAPSKPAVTFSASVNRVDVANVNRQPRPAAERIVPPVLPTSADKRASVQALSKSGIVTAQLSKQFPASSSTSDSSRDSMTVQTDNGTLATVTPAGVGYFQISFGGDTSGGLTVSADMLREVWGIQFSANQTKQVNSSARAKHEMGSLIEELDQRDFTRKTLVQLRHATRRAALAKTLREEAGREQVICTTDSDSDSEEETVRKVSTSTSVQERVRQLGVMKRQ